MAIEYIYIYIYRSGYWQRSLVTEPSKNSTLFIHVISCFMRILGTSFAEGWLSIDTFVCSFGDNYLLLLFAYWGLDEQEPPQEALARRPCDFSIPVSRRVVFPFRSGRWKNRSCKLKLLAGGLEHVLFSISYMGMENHPNWLSLHHFRGVSNGFQSTTNQII